MAPFNIILLLTLCTLVCAQQPAVGKERNQQHHKQDAAAATRETQLSAQLDQLFAHEPGLTAVELAGAQRGTGAGPHRQKRACTTTQMRTRDCHTITIRRCS